MRKCHRADTGFLSTLSLRRATKTTEIGPNLVNNFYPRSPCGERLCVDRRISSCTAISIHALLAESDTPMVTPPSYKHNFYPRSPCGERQLYINRTAETVVFLSTLSLRRATFQFSLLRFRFFISIHALLAESDQAANGFAHAPPQISIHALLAESDSISSIVNNVINRFLSTLSLRRATGSNQSIISQPNNFYPRSPCGERLKPILSKINTRDFYPRSPCGERPHTARRMTAEQDFYPRSPCGERQANAVDQILPGHISIHALLAESDLVLASMICLPLDFYPRSPCGERLSAELRVFQVD